MGSDNFRTRGNQLRIFLLILLFIPLIVRSQENNYDSEYQKAKALTETGAYSQAIETFKKLAEAGFAPAQTSLAMFYLQGNGVDKNPSLAFENFQKAANQGDIQAQVYLAGCYANAIGTPKNVEESAVWFKKAADQGNAKAQHYLGTYYMTGTGVKPDINDAIKLFKFAANQGYQQSQFQLAQIYQNGQGTDKDIKESVKWYKKSAEAGHAESQFKLSLYYANGQGVPKDEIESLAWMNIAASSGNETAARTRTAMEVNLGKEITLYAQQRSKEILDDIKMSKKSHDEYNSMSKAKEFSGNVRGFGTGSFISKDGLLLTAAHVIEDSKRIEVMTSTGKVKAKVIQVDSSNDVALLECSGTYEALPVVTSKLVKLGQGVFTIGFPNVDIQGFSPKLTKGEISSMSGFKDDPRSWQVSVPVQPGNSGGPLLDMNGNLVGIIVSKLSATQMAASRGDIPQNVNYAIKSSYIQPILDKYTSRLQSFDTLTPNTSFEKIVQKTQNSVVLIVTYD
ncbi:MAG: tetratricopeptide repeat-containing serine protease family protein [Verrucomicrobiota bacterium]|nr:tetratricopeptide repeat-containing serine protease family protein [Verrucomicrobiota bacterium]